MSSKKRVAPRKGEAAGLKSEDKDVGVRERRRGLRSLQNLKKKQNKQGDQRGPGQRGAPRYLQRSSRTLPGISTRLVSMMRTHSRSSASRLRAAGDREYGTKSGQRRLQRGRGGKGRDPLTYVLHPQPRTPRGWAEARGGALGVTPHSA